MELNRKKYKIIVNGTSNTSASLTVDDEPLGQVFNFIYLGAILSKGSTYNAEVLTWINTPAIARLERIWKSKINVNTKLYKL